MQISLSDCRQEFGEDIYISFRPVLYETAGKILTRFNKFLIHGVKSAKLDNKYSYHRPATWEIK